MTILRQVEFVVIFMPLISRPLLIIPCGYCTHIELISRGFPYLYAYSKLWFVLILVQHQSSSPMTMFMECFEVVCYTWDHKSIQKIHTHIQIPLRQNQTPLKVTDRVTDMPSLQ